jgi:hypothetical protein
MLRTSLAPSTQKVYSRAWTLYNQFSTRHLGQRVGIDQLPLSSNSILMYVSYLNITGYAPATAISYVSAIGYTHRAAGHGDPTSHTLVQKSLASLTKANPSCDSRLPITLVVLHQLMAAADITISSLYIRTLIKAMFSVAFFGLMRVGEITSKKSQLPALLLSQLTRQSGNFILQITKFKHNHSQQPLDIVLKPHSQTQLCPVRNLQQYLSHRGIKESSLFCYSDGNPITREFFINKLKTCIEFCGLEAARYKSHSFRIGGASYLASLGHSDAQIRVIGRWRSEAFKRYIRCQRIQLY